MKTEGLRYTYVEAKDEHGPYFKILEDDDLIAYAIRKAAALQIARALNRDDLRVFAKRSTLHASRSTPHPPPSTPKRPARRRFRSKRKIY